MRDQNRRRKDATHTRAQNVLWLLEEYRARVGHEPTSAELTRYAYETPLPWRHAPSGKIFLPENFRKAVRYVRRGLSDLKRAGEVIAVPRVVARVAWRPAARVA